MQLKDIFPHTTPLLSEEKLQKFWNLFKEENWRDEDFSYWFPRFLKSENFPVEVIEKATIESICLRIRSDLSLKVRLDSGQMAINPLSEFLVLRSWQKEWNLSPGLYQIVYQAGVLIFEPLTKEDLYILDLIQEDRKWSEGQLLEMAMLETTFSGTRNFWLKKILSLKDRGILIQGQHEGSR